ncbi:MAG TPA: hypothetical protein VFA46_24350 [Actinomycetes bacterium]|nr:hypothetical protein [Actinomycetes bacterium]
MLTTVLRFEAIVHNTKELGVGRALERFCEIINRLAGMAERFCTALDCVDVGFLTDQTLDQLPRSSQLGRTRVGGIDLNEPRIRAALATVLALAAAPRGFTVAELTAKVQHMTGLTQTGYTIRQAAYDPAQAPRQAPHYQAGPVTPLPDPARSRPHHRRAAGPAQPGHRPHPGRCPQPRRGRKPAHWTAVDRDYETLRIGMQTLFADLKMLSMPRRYWW